MKNIIFFLVLVMFFSCGTEPKYYKIDKFYYINNSDYTIQIKFYDNDKITRFDTIDVSDTLDYSSLSYSANVLSYIDSVYIKFEDNKFLSYYDEDNDMLAKPRSIFKDSNYIFKKEINGYERIFSFYYTFTNEDYLAADTIYP